MEVNHDENLVFMLEFMASYAHKIPNEKDMVDTCLSKKFLTCILGCVCDCAFQSSQF